MENVRQPWFSIPSSCVFHRYNDATPAPSYRTVFMRDRDRVMYCTAFRRLAGKTQIYTIGSDDHRKNRLTHSLEVAQIARTIAYALGLNEALAEAIALGHDLGHTPFGHAGEQMLHEIMIPNSKYVKDSPFYNKTEAKILDTLEREKSELSNPELINSMFGFKHNIQSVRVAYALEDSYRDDKKRNIGLNLTNYTLWGMMNHSHLQYRPSISKVAPNYQSGFQDLLFVPGSTSEAWSLEAYVVRLADDIAQWHHDLEDAIRGNALPIKDICKTILTALEKRLTSQDKACLDANMGETRIDRKCIADLSHIVVNTLVTDVVETSRINMTAVVDAIQSSNPSLQHEELSKLVYTNYESLPSPMKKEEIIALSDLIDQDTFKKTIKGSVHFSREVERMNEKGKYIIRKLFEAYNSHPQQLPDGFILHMMVDFGKYENIDEARKRGTGIVRMEFEEEMKNPKLIGRCILMRRICDHIASMTDRYAIEEYNNLYG